MGNRAAKIQEAFWKAIDKPDGFERKYKITHGCRQDAVRKTGSVVTYELWGHPIATLCNGILTLSDEGWKTRTTMDRIDGILGGAPGKVMYFRVRQERGVWYLIYRNWSRQQMEAVKFKWNSGAIIDLNDPFRLLEKLEKKALSKRVEIFNGHIKRFVDNIKKKVMNGTLVSDGGECWGVKFFPGDHCATCEFLLKPGCGGGATLVAKALQEKGYAYPGVWMAEMGEDEKPKVSIKLMQKNWKHPISGALRDFARKRITKIEFERRKADA